MTKKLAVMGSGNGSNFDAIVKHFKALKQTLNEEFWSGLEILCISDNKDAKILKRAKKLGIKEIYLPYEENEDFFRTNKFDLIALAGYMRILTPETLKNGRFINIHPSLLPAFKGKNAILRAYEAGVKVSGVSVHCVNETIDGGKIIAQYPVFINEDMSFAEFEEAIHATEHNLYPVVIEKVMQDKIFNFRDLMNRKKGCSKCC